MGISVGTNFTVIAWCAGYLLVNYCWSGITWPYLICVLIAGYFVADFASGLVHWGIDTWFAQNMLGRAIAIAREHHTHPQNIFSYGFLEHSTLGSAPSAAFIGPASFITALFPISPTVCALMLVWLITSACLFFGTSFHNLGHRNASSRFLRAAQQLHLVITPQHHWIPHRRDQTVRYCVINGWANYPCDLLRFWRGLEWLVHALTGAAPRRFGMAASIPGTGRPALARSRREFRPEEIHDAERRVDVRSRAWRDRSNRTTPGRPGPEARGSRRERKRRTARRSWSDTKISPGPSGAGRSRR